MDRPPIRVCVVVAATAGQAAIVATVRELHATGRFDIAAVLSDARSTLAGDLRACGAAIHEVDFDFAAFPGWFNLTARAARLARLFRRERYDVVITCLWQSMLVGRLAAWIAAVPVRMARVAGPFHLDAPLPRWIDRRTCWMDLLLIGVCQSIASAYRDMGVPHERVKVLHSARDLEQLDSARRSLPVRERGVRDELGLSPDTPLVGMVSWFYPPVSPTYWSPRHLWGRSVKGHETFLEAAARVLEARPDVRFVCVGGGWGLDGERYMAEMRRLADDLGLADSVSFLGARSDVAAIYRELDVVAHPSRSEGPGGAVESLLMRCPTVASRTGGLTDLVVDGVTGLLTNVDDSSDLARAIVELLRDRPRALRLADAGRAHAIELCDAAENARSIATWIDQLLQPDRRRRFRGLTSACRHIVLVPLSIALACGVRFEEAACRARFRDTQDVHASSVVNLAALVLGGPGREQAMAGWVRQRAAVLRGRARGLRQQASSRVGTFRGMLSAWLQRGRP